MVFHFRRRSLSALKIALTLPLLAGCAWAQSVIATIPSTNGTEGNPMTIAVNPLTQRVYIAGSSVQVVDQKTNEVLDTIAVGTGQLNGIAVDPVLRRAYVIDDADGLFAIDLNSNTIVGNYPYSNIYGVAVNLVTHRVYVYGSDYTNGDDAVLVFDGPTLNLLATVDDTFSEGPVPNPQVQMAVNPVTNKIYAVVCLYPGGVWVVDGNTDTSSALITGLAPLANGLDVDPLRNLIWVAGQFGQVSKVNGATNTLISTSNPNTYLNGISVDPANQTVYAISTGDDEVQIIDEKTNTVETATVPVSGAPVNSAIDYIHGLLYVGNTGETYQNNPPPPSVSVISLH
jgi:YVTN family beta-propeller protein